MQAAHITGDTPLPTLPEEAPAGEAEAPFDTAKRHQIMDGARRVFLEHGYDGASIGDVVRAAGVSKGTLYAYFPSKEKLFQALVFENRRKQAEVLFILDEADDDPASVLYKLGISFLEMLVRPETLAFSRVVIGASAKFPEIGRTFYTAGPCFGTERLGNYLRRLTDRGLLRVDNPELAAWQFLDLCKTGIHLRMLLGHLEAPRKEELERNVTGAVRMFLAAYGGKR